MKKVFFALSMLAIILSVNSVQAQDLEDIMGQVASATTKAVYDQEYKFDTYLQMEISDLGDHRVIYDLYTTKDESSYAVQFTNKATNSIILFDTKNSSLLMLTEEGGEKTGVAMGVDPDALSEMTADQSESDKSYAEYKTGETKTILGYKCDEYQIKEDGTIMTIWTSEELGKEVSSEFIAIQGIFGRVFALASGTNQMVLEYIIKDESNGKGSTLKVIRVDLNANNTINVSDYAVMSLGQ